MEWWLVLLIVFGSLMVLMMAGFKVAVAFLLINLVAGYLFWGGEAGLVQVIFSIASSIVSFSFIAVPLFILMGELMFQTEVAPYMLDAIDKWLGRLPGRLGLLAVAGGTLFATLTGAAFVSVAMLGSSLVPEIEKRGYKKEMSLGPILGSGGLAVMIPPSDLAIILGAIAEVSIGKTLIGIIIPSILMAVLFATYIIGRCWLQPSIAPPYVVTGVSTRDKLIATVKYILPVGLIVFLVIGLILLGVCTPTEAAAGALGTFLLAAAYRKLTWQRAKKAITNTLVTTSMLFIIISGAKAFSQILAYTGATASLARVAMGLSVAPLFIIFMTQIVIIILGMFMSKVAIMMITVPVFMPVVQAFGFDPVWFAVLFLLNIEMADISPPFGMSLFVMKGVAPHYSMRDIYVATIPFLILDFIALMLVLFFPQLALWLPGKMRPV